MKEHEIEVKNGKGKKFIVSIEHYENNAGELTATMDEKEATAYCKAHHKAKDAVRAEHAKMEEAKLKNKSR